LDPWGKYLPQGKCFAPSHLPLLIFAPWGVWMEGKNVGGLFI
jgi:hypothetical protein